jgi:ribosomal protein S19E (S16A)
MQVSPSKGASWEGLGTFKRALEQLIAEGHVEKESRRHRLTDEGRKLSEGEDELF